VVIERLHEPGHQPTPPAKNSTRKSVNRSSTPLMIEEKENEQLLIVCDRLATVLWTDWRRQARRSCCSAFQPPESHPRELPRQLIHSNRFHSSFQP